MGAARRGEAGTDDSSRSTLGDLLFGKGRPEPALEREWVALVRGVAGQDPVALHALYSRMHRIVFTVIFRMTRNRETAEELTLDVFHEVWRRASGYDPAGGSVVGWVMNMARSRAIDRLRFEQRQKRSGTPHELVNDAEERNDPGAVAAAQQEGRLVREALAVLTPDERQAIEAAFFSELTYAQVATHLNEPLGTVKSRIRSGLGKLRRALGERTASSP
jgi:RNA polymerase sigma-70 factor (ECF subfamily)